MFIKMNQENFLYTKQELTILKEKIKQAKKFFKKNEFIRDKKIFLLLGPSGHGKSTLLLNSNLKQIDTSSLLPKNSTIFPTKTCIFWYSSEGIFVDTAGFYTQSNQREYSNQKIWIGLIKLLKKHFGNIIQSLLLIFDLPYLLENKSELETILSSFRKRIYETKEHVNYLQIYLIMTKCDRIIGCKDFFKILDKQQLLEPFGILFNPKVQDTVSDFQSKFDLLINNIDNHISNNSDNTSIHKTKLFHIHFSETKMILSSIISKIPNSNLINLNGIFFTSSCQLFGEIDYNTNNYLKTLGVNLNQPDYYNEQKPYFTSPLFQLITNKSKNIVSIDYRSLYLFIGIIITSISLFLGTLYKKNTDIISKIKKEFQLENFNSLPITLTTKDNIGKFYNLDYKKIISQIHSWKINSQQLFFYQNLVEKALEEQIKLKKLDILPNTLRAYLAFQQTSKFEKLFLSQWLKKQLNIDLNPNYPLNNIESINKQLVLDVQQTLINNQLSKNKFTKQPIKLNQKYIFVPEMYLKKYFSHYFHQQCYKTILKLPKLKNQTNKELLTHIQQVYINNYVSFWQNLNNFLGNKSLTKSLIDWNKSNQLPKEINTIINNLPNGIEEFELWKIKLQSEWKNFKIEISKFVTLQKNLNASKWLKEYFQSNGKNWQSFSLNIKNIPGYDALISQIKKQTLNEIAHEVFNEIKKEWNDKIIPKYQQLIHGYYPFDKLSNKDLTKENFDKFFGPGQILENFVKNYLQPYVIIKEHLNWDWKNIENNKLPFGSYFLDIGIRSILIQKAFYINHKLGFSFSLANLESSSKLNLIVDNHAINLSMVPSFNWPINQTVILNYTDNIKTNTLSQHGIWAWFKLLDQIDLKHIKGGKFKISIGKEYFYLLTSSYNPFIPNLLTDFVCIPIQ